MRRKNKVIYYGDIYTKLHDSKIQLSRKKYKQYLKLLQWVENGEKFFKQMIA